MKRRLGHVDLDTGEVLEHATLYAITPRKRNGFGKRWFAMSQDGARGLALNSKALGREGLTVGLYLLSVLDYENDLPITKADIAAELGMNKSNLARAFRKLMEAGFVREGRREGNRRSYRLSPEIAWRGAGRNHVIALDEFRKGRD